MGFLEDWKKFAFRGNAIDLAVGVIIGGAFGKIVSALVEDILMPVVSLAMPGGAWREWGLVLKPGGQGQPDVVLRYGHFVGATVDLMIVALALYLLVAKLMRAPPKAG